MSRFAAAGFLLLTSFALTSCDAPIPNATPASSAAASPAATPVPATACSDERITFGRLTSHDVLTHVTRPGEPTMIEVRSYAPGVVPDRDLPADRIYQAFDAVVDDADLVRLRPLGTVFVPRGVSVRATGPGRVVRYDGVQAVEAMFTYACGGSTHQGVVSSWTRPMTGVLDCALPDRFRGDRPAEDAAALACPKPR